MRIAIAALASYVATCSARVAIAVHCITHMQYQRWEENTLENGSKIFDKSLNASEYTLTYSQLINYYNELVIHLRLAQYNLNVSIPLEVKEESLSKALKEEEQIIKLLNESILPALETTVSHYS